MTMVEQDTTSNKADPAPSPPPANNDDNNDLVDVALSADDDDDGGDDRDDDNDNNNDITHDGTIGTAASEEEEDGTTFPLHSVTVFVADDDVEKQQANPDPGAVEKPSVDKQKNGVESEKKKGCNSKKWIIIAMVVIVLVFVVVFPVAYVVTSRQQSNELSTSSSTNDDGGGGDNRNNIKNEPTAKKAVAARNGPFNSTLRSFNDSIAEGYSGDVEELKADLTQASWFLLNLVVHKNLRTPGYEDIWFGGGGGDMGGMVRGADFATTTTNEGGPTPDAQRAPSAPAADESDTAGTSYSSQTNTNKNTEDSYGTNNQEEDIEEGDVVVSDGKLGKSVQFLYILRGKIMQSFISTRQPNQPSFFSPWPLALCRK